MIKFQFRDATLNKNANTKFKFNIDIRYYYKFINRKIELSQNIFVKFKR